MTSWSSSETGGPWELLRSLASRAPTLREVQHHLRRYVIEVGETGYRLTDLNTFVQARSSASAAGY
jgi:hypothetical protein